MAESGSFTSIPSRRISGATVAKLTQCAVCLDTFINPRMLPCGHTFCLTDCLVSVIRASVRKDGKFPCPTCRKQHAVPPEGAGHFPRNIHISHLLEEEVKPPKSSKVQTRCDQPPSGCSRCCQLDHKDRHQCHVVSSHGDALHERLGRVSAGAEAHRARLEGVASLLAETETRIRDDVETATKLVSEDVEELCRLAQQRGKEMIQALRKNQQTALSRVRVQKNNLDMKIALAASLQECSVAFQTSDDLLEHSRELEAQLDEQRSAPLHPLKWSSSTRRLARSKTDVRGLLGSVTMETKEKSSQQPEEDVTNILGECEKTIAMECDKDIHGMVVTGRYVCVVHWKDSHLWVYDKDDGRLLRKCALPGVENPYGMALLAGGHRLSFVIGCYMNDALHFVRLSNSLDLAEHKVVKMATPGGVSVSPFTRDVIVADSSSDDRAAIYARDGREVSQVALPSGVIGALRCVLQTSAGRYVALDWSNPGKVVWLGQDGRVEHIYGTGPGEELDDPFHMVQDPTGRLIVADMSNNRLHVIGPDGRLERHLLEGQGVRRPHCLYLTEGTDRRLYVGHGGSRDRAISVYKYKATADQQLEFNLNIQLGQF